MSTVKKVLVFPFLTAVFLGLAACGVETPQAPSVDDIIDDGGGDDGGAQPGGGETPPGEDGDDNVELPSSFELEASKDYGPSRFFPDEETMPADADLEIPAEWVVTSGNAGNHNNNKLKFADITCYYKGGASQSHPNNPGQIEKGLKYKFDASKGCRDLSDTKLSLVPGDAVSVLKDDVVRMEVANGSHRAGKTTATVSITVTEWK